MVVNSVRLNRADTLEEYEPFLLDEESRESNTEVEAEFIIKGSGGIEQRYRYGFAFSDRLIAEEWLYIREGDSDDVELFYREGGNVQVNKKAFPEGKDKEDKLVNNRLLLSLIAQLNGEKSNEIIEWFSKSPFVSALRTEKYMPLTSELLKSQKKRKKVDRKYAQMALIFLSNIDMRIEELSIREEQIILPKDMPEELKKLFSREGNMSLKVESTHNRYDKNGSIIGKEIFNLAYNESEGTQKITELLGLIFTVLAEGRLLLIDELDAKLHPLLTRAIIQLFTDPKINEYGAQLVFTTHDTNQLHLGFVRRDEIWFTEKSSVEATELYSHIEFKDFDPSMDITEQYVNGRYGAIPRIKVQR